MLVYGHTDRETGALNGNEIQNIFKNFEVAVSAPSWTRRTRLTRSNASGCAERPEVAAGGLSTEAPTSASS